MTTNYLGEKASLSNIVFSARFLISWCIPVLLFILIFLQGWTSLWLLAFPWIIFGFNVWYNSVAILKDQTFTSGILFSYNPFGKEKKMGSFFFICTIGLQGILLALGQDSLYHYQLMPIYGYFYIIPLITLYNIIGFWIPFTIWQDAEIHIAGSEKEKEFIVQLNPVQIRSIILIAGIILGLLEIVWVVDTFLWNYGSSGIWLMQIVTPGVSLYTGALIDCSGFLIIVLFASPVVLIGCLQFVSNKIKILSTEHVKSIVDSWVDPFEYKRKILYSINYSKK
jgi:hypothetical protein